MGEGLMIDKFAVIRDNETMQSIVDAATEGNVEAQKLLSGLVEMSTRIEQGAGGCISCSAPITEEDSGVGAYLVGINEHSNDGVSMMFCWDCASKHDDVKSFTAAGIKGMQRGFNVRMVGDPGHA